MQAASAVAAVQAAVQAAQQVAQSPPQQVAVPVPVQVPVAVPVAVPIAMSSPGTGAMTSMTSVMSQPPPPPPPPPQMHMLGPPFGDPSKPFDTQRRTIYVCDVDSAVSEDLLKNMFQQYGTVLECRICVDPNSRMRFAFVEFNSDVSANLALEFNGTVIGNSPVRVLPSRTSIVPVNPTYLPRSEHERVLADKTIYVANVDNAISKEDLRSFFEGVCGPVGKLRLLADKTSSKSIAFVEFMLPECAAMALNCSGAILGTSQIRVSPSKTPVRNFKGGAGKPRRDKRME